MANLNNAANNSQDWTVERLVNFRRYIANAFSPGIYQAESIAEDDNWTTENLNRMSKSLARAYGSGL